MPTTRIESTAVRRRRASALPLVIALFIASIALQRGIDPTVRDLHKNEGGLSTASAGLSNEFVLLPLLGFREAAAGLLWVRCDEFFHSGDYDAILPLVRLITYLDPHAENVYVTGAWHLAYNFTDSSERSDRRYVGPAQRLLDEGIANNPRVPDVTFEKAWQNFDKIKDYSAAEIAFRRSLATPPTVGSDDYPYGAPLKTFHMLAHSLVRQGKIPEALEAWQQALVRSKAMLEPAYTSIRRDPSSTNTPNSARMLREMEVHNYKETLERYHDRYTKDNHSHVNPSPYPAVIRPAKPGGKMAPWDVAFHPKVRIVRPKVFKIGGRFNSADGARIEVRIKDYNLPDRPINFANDQWDVHYEQTILQDTISVRKDKFEREIDMSKDPKMYGFNQPKYKVILSYNPRPSSPHLQDRFGWSGEGITNGNKAWLSTSVQPLLNGTLLIPGLGGKGAVWDGVTVPFGQFNQPLRTIRVTYLITKAQILNQQPITEKNIVPNDRT